MKKTIFIGSANSVFNEKTCFMVSANIFSPKKDLFVGSTNLVFHENHHVASPSSPVVNPLVT